MLFDSLILMARFLLFSSRNDIAPAFIRLARSQQHRVLCLTPYHNKGPEALHYHKTITSLGGIPLQYSFRDGRHGYGGHQIKSLVSLLKATDGVVWAAHPFMREATWSPHHDAWFKDYMQDLDHVLNLLEVVKVRNFVCLSVYPDYKPGTELQDEEEWSAFNENRMIAKAVVDLVSKRKSVQWSIVHVPYEVSFDEGDDSAQATTQYSNWVDDVAKTIMDVLSGGQATNAAVNVKNHPNETSPQISNANTVPAAKDTPTPIPPVQPVKGPSPT